MHGVALSDLNGDGFDDLIVVNGGASSVGVYLGTAPGEFGAPTQNMVGANPQSVAVEDIDGDGNRDLVVTNAGDHTFSVLRGNGDGTFQAQEVHATGLGPAALLIVEITGDGYPDVVVANAGEQSVSVFFGGETGAFGTRVDVALPGAPSALAADELNDLAGLDLAVACAPNHVAIVAGDFAGHFTLGNVLTVGADPRSIVARDLDNDGRTDLVTADRGANALSVLVSIGSGDFAPATSLPMGAQPTAVAFQDMDYDGWSDLVCLQAGDGTVSVSRGHGTLTFSPRRDLAASASPTGLLVWDLNQDSYLDFVTWDESAGTVDLHMMNPILNGELAFVQQPSSFVAGTPMPNAVKLRVTDELGAPVVDEPVWIWMDGGGDLLNGSEEVLTDGDGVATFPGLSAVVAGRKLLYAWTATLNAPPSDEFVVSAGPATDVRFAVQPTHVLVGAAILPAVRAQVTDVYGNAVEGAPVSIALEGPGTLTGCGTRATDVDGYASFDSLVVDALGTHRLIAQVPPSLQSFSEAFTVLPPPVTLHFAIRVPMATGFGCLAATSADFNGDGVPDLAAANTTTNKLSVMLGTGGGVFAAKVDYVTASSPISIAAADLDRDGHMDLVVANRGSNSVSVLRGLGTGAFAPRTDLAVGMWPWAFAIADFNSDLVPDIATANEGDRTVSVLLGLAGGGFAPATSINVGQDPLGLASGDVDRDGDQDLVVTLATNRVMRMLGNGLGGFALTAARSTVGSPRTLALADMNGDGRLDAVASSYSDGLAVHLGQADGTFDAGHLYMPGYGMSQMVVGDVDGDGHQDVFFSNVTTHSVSVMLGDGNGALWPPQTFPAATNPWAAAIADLNQDGFADLVTADNDENTVSVYLQSRLAGASIAFVTQPSIVAKGAVMSPAVRVKVSDSASAPVAGAHVALSLVGGGTLSGGGTVVTGADGIATFASLIVDSTGTHRLVASCAGTLPVTSNSFNVLPPVRLFAVARTFPVGTNPRCIAAADLDGDAALDLVVANITNNTISVLRGYGDGTYAPKVDYPAIGGPGTIRIADINRDGRLDLVVAGAATHAFSLMLGNGNGTFAAHVDFDYGNPAGALQVGDIDLDGKLDVVTSASSSNYLSVRLGNGDGTFGTRRDVTAAGNPVGIVIADVTGDGRPDLLTASIAADLLFMLPGNGDGTFGAAQSFDAGDQPHDLIAGDWNGDGKLDVATANYDSNTVSVLMGAGDGSFGPRTRYKSGVQPYRLAAADLDRDGRLDIVSANMSTTISVFRGLAGGTFSAKDDYASPLAFDVVLADLDSNGSLDMAAPNYSASTVSVFLNTMSLPTPTLIELFRATASTAGVRVEWQLSDAAALRTCALERASSEAGEWAAVSAAPVAQGALQVVVDADAPAGVTSWYRLRGTLRNGTPFTYGPVSAEGMAVVRTLELAAPWPNPSRGAATMSFGLPSRAHVRLALVDLQGREVALLADGVRDAGRQVALLDASDLSPGIYFARLQSGGASLVRRFVIVK
ncbi:MAG: VCBS repeat-containing protein [Candidatus Eisenbacteria bacterium]|uniref:VCBS repeat-containing protein n=1 Tax=Eiseniibacteriota bacterium TaxID=2212470 RepID=A0A933W8N6_UNCEI|nr:VCBS repeat-containing protein [Candidatus Eisenbacteria bacterium]